MFLKLKDLSLLCFLKIIYLEYKFKFFKENYSFPSPRHTAINILVNVFFYKQF